MFGNALFVSRASGTAVASSKASPHRDLDVRKLVGGFRAKQTSLGAGGYTTWSNMPHNKLPPDNDFNRNPRAYFTNRRGTWFDDYTKYRPYVAVPANIPLFQSRDNALFKLRIACGFPITNRAWNCAQRRLVFRTGSLCRLAPSSRLRERTAWRATV